MMGRDALSGIMVGWGWYVLYNLVYYFCNNYLYMYCSFILNMKIINRMVVFFEYINPPKNDKRHGKIPTYGFLKLKGCGCVCVHKLANIHTYFFSNHSVHHIVKIFPIFFHIWMKLFWVETLAGITGNKLLWGLTFQKSPFLPIP